MKRLSSALMFLALAVPAFAAADEYSPDHIRAFTRFLIGKKEYYRAFVELKRLKSYYPESITPFSFSVTENYLLFMGKQYSAILSKPAGQAGPLFMAADSIFKFDSAAMIADYGRLENCLSSWPSGADPFLERCFKKRRLAAYLMERRYDAASEFIAARGNADFSAYRELIEQARSGFSYEKKPWLSAVLGIIPGMGYMYSEDYATGIFAFLLVSADFIMTYFAFRTHNDVIGYFTGVIGGFFYAGSIAGGYLAAQRFNIRLADSNKTSLMKEMRLDRDRDDIFEKHGIGKD